jgi:hypothetical protein
VPHEPLRFHPSGRQTRGNAELSTFPCEHICLRHSLSHYTSHMATQFCSALPEDCRYPSRVSHSSQCPVCRASKGAAHRFERSARDTHPSAELRAPDPAGDLHSEREERPRASMACEAPSEDTRAKWPGQGGQERRRARRRRSALVPHCPCGNRRLGRICRSCPMNSPACRAGAECGMGCRMGNLHLSAQRMRLAPPSSPGNDVG